MIADDFGKADTGNAGYQDDPLVITRGTWSSPLSGKDPRKEIRNATG